MLGLSLSHLIVIGVVVMLFGARRLPELGSALGRGMHAFKKGMAGDEELEELPSLDPGREEGEERKNKDSAMRA